MKRIAALALIGVLLIGVALWRRAQVAPSSVDATAPTSAAANATSNGISTSGPAAIGTSLAPGSQASVATGVAPQIAARPANAAEITSLENTTRAIIEFARKDRKIDDLVEWLKKSGQNPSITRDSNPYTGDMTVVRTQNPPPGTRYFYAQFFSGQDTPAFIQHMSFEFKPGPKAFDQAKAAIQKVLGKKARPSEVRGLFVRYELNHGYIYWCKQMDHEDLEENPINKYSPADKGTIRCALELSPHEAGE